MTSFSFVTDEESEAYVREVVDEMMRRFNLSEEEAVGRVNRFWRNQELVGHYNLIYHEPPSFFAKTIYYGPAVPWWKGEAGLRPIPFP